LIVDDEKNIRATFQAILERDGHEVFARESVSEAITLLEAGPVDVLVTDIVMPRQNGTDLLARARELDRDLQVVMVTGQPTAETAAASLRAGAFDYLAKPIQSKSLRKVVGNAARVRALQVERRQLEQDNQKYQLQLQEMVKERTSELIAVNDRLRETVQGVISAMAMTVEKKDPYTAGHQERVAKLARAIAEEMALDEDRATGTYLAAFIHDIGKVAVPAEILTKPTTLCQEEFALIKRHTVAGWDILKAIRFPWPIAKIVRQHHERINGSGYPDGLSGEEILIEARIVAVADTVESMASHRPYRPALGIQVALDEIESNRGKLFDEDVVDSCLRLFREKGYTLSDALSDA
jgi:putative nucleotidyltransferase with HDIG domain